MIMPQNIAIVGMMRPFRPHGEIRAHVPLKSTPRPGTISRAILREELPDVRTTRA
jgi:hypothetical protein